MEVFRITKQKYAQSIAASGNEARWNYKGECVIYTASTRALASLELLVHLSGIQLKFPYKINVIHIPDDMQIINIYRKDMPANWNALSPYKETQKLGSKWLKSKTSCILRAPSSIIIGEYNYIINENHPDFGRLKIIDTENHLFDPRLIDKMQ